MPGIRPRLSFQGQSGGMYTRLWRKMELVSQVVVQKGWALPDFCLEVRGAMLLTLTISNDSAGGNSFYAARYGLACDNIVNFQVVLASGTIVNANSKTNHDLFKALKGGSSNFGIVTRFDMRTFPLENLWGGVVIHNISTSSQQIPAIIRFTDNVHKDPSASLIAMWSYDSQSEMEFIGNALHYTKPVAYPPAYDDLYKLANMSSTMRIDSLYNLTTELEQEGDYRYGSLIGCTISGDLTNAIFAEMYSSQAHT